MAPEEYRAFMLEGTRTAKLATVRADGRPHLAPVWFLLDGERIVFTTWHQTVKAANLRRDPSVSLCVDAESPPFAFALVEGVAEITEVAPDLRTWATRLAARYMGPDLAESYGARNAVPGEWLIRVIPTRIIASANVAD
jgi:PPOX class probable F420-dependent enzyme